MAGNADEGFFYVLLLIFGLLVQINAMRRRRRFLRRLRMIAMRNWRRRMLLYHRVLLMSRPRQWRRKTVWTHNRPQFWFEDLMANQYDDAIWKRHFRVNRNTFMHICNLVQPQLTKRNTHMRRAIPVEKRVAAALWRLATGDTYRATGLVFGIGRCTAMNIRDEFCSALLDHANEFIRFPIGEDETRRSIEAFQILSDFPQVVGALDGSHIPIAAPTNDPNDYFNRKHFHSIILQGVAAADKRFIHISTGYPGSIHDARVLRMSSLNTAIENANILASPVMRTREGLNLKPLLVADPAYKLRTWCMKPYPETAAIMASQATFNKSLSKARVVVEQSFGLLKGRWRCLLTKLDESVDKVSETVKTCCVLHNICIDQGDDIVIDPPCNDGHNPPIPRHDVNIEGTRLRERIRQSFY